MLNHMILHLQDVCTGLGELAAKTRIKIGETTKDIFQIQVPPWQDAAARTSIRDYLNALTAELDRADEGEEPEVKSRAILEKKLRTQPMLRCIFGNQTIKVRCRKATSGNTFSPTILLARRRATTSSVRSSSSPSSWASRFSP